LICMYVRNSSSGLIFTISSFIVFLFAMFTVRFYGMNVKAYTDPLTGLNNRSRWDEMMNGEEKPGESYGIMMMDLNHLKSTNDVMGHEFGDKMIRSFAWILRESVPREFNVCRWGGDEFAVIVWGADEKLIMNTIKAINENVEKYNCLDGNPEISYAVGYALSTEFPELSKKKMFEKADERMYSNKKLWY
ncbi:MAG: GGDEF domain-containing protein, partial [Bacillota bacterium]|nr:GGDEF domain-containing protein [Bacillota bacterium]